MEQQAGPDELLGVAVVSVCCLLISGGGFLAVLVWLLRSRTSTPATQQQYQGYTPPPPAPVTPPASEFHLSVIALAFDGYFRQQVELMLAAPLTAVDPVGARVELVQRAARGLLGVEPQWRHFGYGEKDLSDAAGAQQSFSNAVADFKTRSAASEDGGVLAVLTVILCTRGRRLGVDRLDTRAQVHELLADRLKVDTGSLLGAEILWGPPSGGLTETAIRERFPEMHALL